MKSNQYKEFDALLKEWSQNQIGRRSFLASLPFLMAACSTRDTSGRYREGDNTGQDVSLTPDDEKKLTLEVLPKMQKDYPPYKDENAQKYIQALGNKIVKANGLHQNPYQYDFTLVDATMVNAFALPAGTVFVTAPLVLMTDSEAELAGVIGHEIGHIQARHTAERMEVAKKAQSASWKYALGGGLLGGLLGYGLGKLACPPEDKKCLQEATQTGAGLGVGGALLVQKYAFMQNSQEDELEADRIGFRTSFKSGFHRDHVGGFYNKLYQMEQDRKSKQGGNSLSLLNSLQDALSTHPPSKERVEQMKKMTNETPLNSSALVSSTDFVQIKKKLKEQSKKS